MFISGNDDLDLITRAIVLGPLGLFWIIMTVRIIGLRTFSKMTAFDFVSTVAAGSLLSYIATATTWPNVIQASIGLFAVLGTQAILAKLRKHSDKAMNFLQNDPALIMRNGEWIEDALVKTRVSRADIWAKLREANVTDLSKIRAVILETTGDVSVLHADTLDEELLTGVTGRKSDSNRNSLN